MNLMKKDREDVLHMTIPIEEYMPYRILALLVMLIFYGIYLTKMMVQKHHGIRTRQFGSRKEKTIQKIEIGLCVATLGIIPVQLFSIITDWNYMTANARFSGFCVGMIGNLVFLIAVIGMKDSWRAGIPDKDKTKLVTTGISKYSRNPAFLGFDLMYIGLLLMYCNPLNLIFTIFAIIMLNLQILQEEKFLCVVFGDEYREYRKKVFRYLGRK